MSANKAKETGPEVTLRKALWQAGFTGYRKNWRKAPGTPDIAFPVKKIAIFVNGCFWHRCPKCNLPLPKSNRRFWKEKFGKNVLRDKAKLKKIRSQKWRALVIWECDLKRNLPKMVNKIGTLLD
jgi:DNA mismatch endonuclease (patch repair protein)